MTAAPSPTPTPDPFGGLDTVVDIVRRHRASELPAITFEGSTWTYADLDRRSNRAAQLLARLGVGRGDRVLFLEKNRPEFFELFFGAAKLGAVCIPANWRLSTRELAHVLRDAEPVVMVTGTAFADSLADLRDASPATRLLGLDPGLGVPVLEQVAAECADVDPGLASTADDLALILYTSGTTGDAKGVMLLNRNFYGMADAAGPLWRFRRGMVSLGVSPLCHIAGVGWNLMVLAAAGHVILHREVDAESIVADIGRYAVTHGLLVPAILQMVLDQHERSGVDDSSLEVVLYGASPISDEVLLELLGSFDCDFMQGYGLTETSGAVTLLAPEDHDPSRPELLRSCGRPLPGVEIRIVDPDSGAERPEGVDGEVVIRAPQVMAGYLGRPDATREVVDPEGWFRTGDAGHLRDGRLYLRDRIKDMIVSGAENVYPAEVENVLVSHPDVLDAAVVGVPSERWGEEVKAVVVRRPGSTITEADLIDHARSDLAGYKCPRSVDFVDELPRNAAGKVLKRALRERYWASEARRIG